MKAFQAPVTSLCTKLCDHLLAQYASNPAANWKHKDTAITVFIAISVTAETRARGT